MKPSKDRRFLTIGLTAAALLFAGANVSGTAQEILADDPAVKQDTNTTGSGRSDQDSTEENVRVESEGASAGVGLLAAGDPVHSLPETPSARAIRGTGTVQLRGAFWLALPRSEGDTGKSPPTRPDALVTLQALDLRDTARDRRIAAAGIRLIPELQPIPAAKLLSTVRVDGRGTPAHWTAQVPLVGVSSGTYRGYILATSEEDSATPRRPVVIPVVVRVKDGPVLAGLILLVGLLLALGLRWYRDTVRVPDEAYLRIDNAKELIVHDALLSEPDCIGAPFRRRFARHLRAAAAALESGALPSTMDTANAHIAKANALWIAWQEERPDWAGALRREWSEIRALVLVQPASTHVAALLDSLRNGYEAAPDYATAVAGAGTPPVDEPGGSVGAAGYRKAVTKRSARVVRYRDFMKKLEDVRGEAAGVPDAEKKRKLLEDVDVIQREWDAFANPDDDDLAKEKKTELEGRLHTARAEAGLAGLDPGPLPESADTLDAVGNENDHGEPADPGLIPHRFAPRIRGARGRRRVYLLIATAIVYTALVLFGFKETWGENPEFGADWLTDYLGVFAWALGVNALNAATFTTFGGQWSLPWLRSTTTDPAPHSRDEGQTVPEMAPAADQRWRTPRLRRL